MKLAKLSMSILALCLSFTVCAKEEVKAPAKETVQIDEVTVNIQNRQINLNDTLLTIGRHTNINLVLAPELSGPEQLKKMLTLTLGEQKLSDVLAVICKQIGGKWAYDAESKSININAATEAKEDPKNKDKKPLDKVITLNSYGEPLLQVAQKINSKTATEIVIPPQLAQIKIELSIKDWPVKRILDNICFMYDLQYSQTEQGKIIFSKKLAK